MKTVGKKNNGNAEDAAVAPIARLAAGSGPLSAGFRMACSQIKAVTPENFRSLTLTDAAKAELTALRGARIFDTSMLLLAKPPPHAPRVPATCPLDKRVLDGHTYRQILRSPALTRRALKWAGSWVVFVRRGAVGRGGKGKEGKKEGKPKYVASCGFYDCGGGSDVDRLVKHMNLCVEHANNRGHGGGHDYGYMCSGTFVAAADRIPLGKDDSDPAVLVNLRSGSWAMAKVLLRLAGRFPSDLTDAELDDRMAAFAERHVRPVVVYAMRQFRR